MNNTSSNAVQNIISKIPISLYFSESPDRQQSLKYIQWLYTNVPESKTADQDQLFREVISKHLRMVAMKIIEIEILLLVGLSKITLADFTVDNKGLVTHLISENTDKYDLDTMYRILAQVMTKLPKDLQDKVAGRHKLQIFQAISRYINMEPQLLEKFMASNPALNTPISMDLDAGDYSALNNKYLTELKEYQTSQPYLDSNSMDFMAIANQMAATIPTATATGIIKGQYIDSNPDLMVGADNKLYYFDSSSGTISEMPNSSNQSPMSINDLTTVLLANKVNKGQIQNLISQLNPAPSSSSNSPMTTQPASFLSRIESRISNLFSTSKPEPAPTVAPTNPASCPPMPPAILSIGNRGVQLQGQQRQQVGIQGGIQGGIQSGIQGGLSANILELLKQGLIKEAQLVSSAQGYLPAPTRGDFLTAVDACRIPNPPAYCYYIQDAAKPNSDYDKLLEAKYAARDSTYNHSGIPDPSNPNAHPTYTSNAGMFLDPCKLPSPDPKYTCFATPTTAPTTAPTAAPTTAPTQISGFTNMKNSELNLQINNETALMQKLTKSNKDIENVAIGFVSVIILLFLLVIFNSIRNKSGLVKK